MALNKPIVHEGREWFIKRGEKKLQWNKPFLNVENIITTKYLQYLVILYSEGLQLWFKTNQATLNLIISPTSTTSNIPLYKFLFLSSQRNRHNVGKITPITHPFADKPPRIDKNKSLTKCGKIPRMKKLPLGLSFTTIE